MSVTVFYASDVHGSDVLWRKFVNAGKFYGADVLVMGGDVAGKAVVPITKTGDCYVVAQQGRIPIGDEAALVAAEKGIRDRGFYPFRTTEEELASLRGDAGAQERVFADAMRHSLEAWVALAEERLRRTGPRIYVMLGNDDEPELRDVFRRSDVVCDSEDVVVELGEGFTMISCGWSNPTPWKSPREMSEDDLLRHLEEHVAPVADLGRCVFNLHVPPYSSGLDGAPALDDNLKPVVSGGVVSTMPVGSTSVRKVIEQHQPPLALHGHIHESRGIARIGRTVCMNPGSAYSEGVLHGALVVLDRNKGLRSHHLTSG